MICSSVNRLTFMSIPFQVTDSTHSWRKCRGSGHMGTRDNEGITDACGYVYVNGGDGRR